MKLLSLDGLVIGCLKYFGDKREIDKRRNTFKKSKNRIPEMKHYFSSMLLIIHSKTVIQKFEVSNIFKKCVVFISFDEIDILAKTSIEPN